MMAADNPERARLVAARLSERSRLSNLTRRLGELDAERHGHAMAALQETIRTAADRLADIEAELAGPIDRAGGSHLRVQAIKPTRGPDDLPMTIAEAKASSRARLRMVLFALHTLPEGCAQAAAMLRRAIKIELKRLDKLKGIGARAKRGRAA
jgi:hypothetical protein